MSDQTINPSGRSEFERTVEPVDSDLERNRLSRNAVFAACMVALPIALTTFGSWLLSQFFDDFELMQQIGGGAGLSISIGLNFYLAEKYFIIRNSTTGLFVTQNTLASLFGSSNINVAYGPGTHISYPVERRLKENNISLLEASIPFSGIVVQCLDGVLTLKGSYRARPRSHQAVRFLTGVASAADDVTSLIAADIVSRLGVVTVDVALAQLKELNEYLHHYSNPDDDDKKALENRFGIEIGDVTVDEMLESEEVRRTRSALSEANAIMRGTWKLLGVDDYKNSAAALRNKIRSGELTQADVNLARDRFLSISGNLEGMNINRTEFDLSLHGLDPEAIKAITDLAKSPAAQAYAAAAASRSGGHSKKKRQDKGNAK